MEKYLNIYIETCWNFDKILSGYKKIIYKAMNSILRRKMSNHNSRIHYAKFASVTKDHVFTPTKFSMGVQRLLWLDRPTREWESRLQQMHVKTTSANVAFSFLREGFISAASLCFFPPRSIPRWKSSLQCERPSATSSHLSMSMSIANHLLQTSLKPVASST